MDDYDFRGTTIKTIIRYIICYDQNAELSFRVTVELMGASVRISVIKEDYIGDMCTVVQVYYMTDPDIQVSMT